MADNFTIATRDGDLDLRAVEATAGLYQPVQKVAPHMPSVVSGGQYNQTVTTGAVFTITIPSGATHCLVTVSTNDVNFTEDGTTPTTSTGLRLPAGFVGELAIPQALKFIGVSGTATVNVTYRRYV